jgi:hypothetical protein
LESLSPSADLPLNVLLARSVLSLTREYERSGENLSSLAMLLVAFRVVDDDGVDPADASTLARASRRAMHALLKTTGFERRDERVYLTAAGQVARAEGFAALAAAESAWTSRVGKARVAAVRKGLVELVDTFELELPHYWVSYGGVDPRVTGGNFRAAQLGPPRIPAHGQDWKPVLRSAGSSAASLSLTALLSQALVAFAIEYETHAGSLSDAVHALAPLDPAGAPLKAAPPRAELTGTGKSRLERHGIVKVESRPGRGPIARLTSLGEYLRDAYGPTTARVEATWRDRYGEAVSRLRSALETVFPKLEDGLADHPFLVWSLRDGIREATG